MASDTELLDSELRRNLRVGRPVNQSIGCPSLWKRSRKANDF